MQASDDDLRQRFEKLDRRLLDAFTAEGEETPASHYSIQQELSASPSRYEIGDEVGRGGSKIIYEAMDRRTDCRVALAVMKEGAEPERIEAFFREARINAKLVHPNIIRVHDLGFLPDQRPYFTMTLTTSESLAAKCLETISGKDVGPHRRHLVDIFIRICEGMAYAHSRDALHLDLKPDNIQVGHFGETVIADWGLARIIGDDTEALSEGGNPLSSDLLNQMTLDGVVKGTPGYMAPEQVKEGDLRIPQTDVYALGAILYTMLTGVPPVRGDLLHAVLEDTRLGRISPPRALCPDRRIPAGLERICMHALATDPGKRYASVLDLQADVVRYRDGYATEAEDAGFLAQTQLFFKRNPRICLLSGAFIVVLILVAVGFVVRLDESRSDALYALDAANTAKRNAQLAETRAVVARDVAEDARKESKLMRDEADAARNRAVQAVDMLAEKTQEQERLSSELADVLRLETQEVTRSYDFAGAMKRINKALAHDPTDADIRLQKAFTHLILQEYTAAAKALPSQLGAKDQDLRTLVTLFDVGATNEGYPAPDQVCRFLQAVAPNRHFFRRYVFMHALTQHKGLAGLPIVECMLEIENGLAVAPKIVVSGRSPRRKLSASGAGGLRRIDFPQERSNEAYSVFNGLGVRHLDISHTGITRVRSLAQLGMLSTLNIEGTPILSLVDLAGCKKLATLIVSKGQFSEGELSRLPGRITVIER